MMQSGRQFLLRPKVLELGAAYLDSMDIETLTRTYLEELAQSNRRFCGDDGAGRRGNRVRRARLGAHAGAPGSPRGQPFPGVCDLDGPRAAGGAQRRAACDSTSRPSSRRSRNTPSPIARSCAQLIDECRRAVYAAVEEELAYGVVAVAVPVLDASGRVVAALNSSSHSKRHHQRHAGRASAWRCCRR